MHRHPTGRGKIDTRALIKSDGKPNRSRNAGKPYDTITWAEILKRAEAPSKVPKNAAPWAMASTYSDFDARTAEVQREKGLFALLPGDIDDGNVSQADLETALHRVLGPCEWVIYSSASAQPDKRKWRFWVPLAQPLSAADFTATQKALIDLLQAEGIAPDEKMPEPGRIFFLPNVPRDKRDTRTGKPLFYRWKHNKAPRLELHPKHRLTLRVAERAAEAAAEAQRVAEEREVRASRKAAQRAAQARSGTAPADFASTVAAFNAQHDLAAELVAYGWTGGPVHFRSPFQTSDSFATRLYPEGYAISLSESDAAAGLGHETVSGARRFDAFELFAHFEHGGDRGAAARAWQALSTPRDARGRFTGSTALVTDRPAPLPDFVTVAEAAERIRGAVRRFVQDKPPVMAIAASPGAGKSRHAREILAEALPDLGGDVAYYAPTLDLAEEAAEHFRELGVRAVAVRGRLAQDVGREDRLTEGDEGLMCLRPGLVRAARSAGLAEGQNVCRRGRGLLEERCPHWDKCPWVQQWAVPEGPIVRCMAHNYLHLPDGSGRGTPALHIVDESCWQGAIGKGEVPVGDWLQVRSPQGFGSWDVLDQTEATAQAADMLAAARDVLAVLQDGGSLQELALYWTPEDFRTYAKAEDQRPMLRLGPGAEDRELRDKIGRLQRVDRHAGKRAAIWRVLADAIEAGRAGSERVIAKGDKIAVHWRKEMPKGPTLHLDADADPVILGALYPAAEIEIVKAELRPRAEVVQVTDKTFSKRALIGTEAQPGGKGLRGEIRQLVRAEVLRDRAQNGGGVLAVATKAVVQKIFEDAGQEAALGAELWGAKWVWYGPASKGLNDWRDFGTVIEIGREELPPSAIEDQARGLWGDGAGPLALPEADEHGNVQVPEAVLPVLMADGSAKALSGRAYADPRLRALQMQGRENAGRQAAERLRMAHGVMPKRWLRLNRVPLPTVPVAELVTWGELKPTRLQAAVAEAAQRKGVLRLSPKGLAEDAPETFPTVKGAERWVSKVIPPPPVIESLLGVGGVKLSLKVKGQRGPTPTAALIPAVTCPEAAKTLLEQAFGPLAHFEVLETVPTPTDSAVSDQANRLESIAKRLGYRPQVTVRSVETPVFVAGQVPAGVMAEALRRRGWPVVSAAG